MDVTYYGQKILIGVDQNRVIPFLEHVAGGIQTLLDAPGIGSRDTLHHAAQWNGPDLDDQMHVICHQAITMNTRAESGDRSSQNFQEKKPVALREKDVLAMISAERHVIKRARYVKAMWTGHPCFRSYEIQQNLVRSYSVWKRD